MLVIQEIKECPHCKHMNKVRVKYMKDDKGCTSCTCTYVCGNCAKKTVEDVLEINLVKLDNA